LRGLGLPPGEIRFIIDTFKRYDETRLYEDYAHYTDTEKMRQFAMQRAEELAQILAEDWQVAAAEAAKRPGEKQRPEPKLVSAAADGDPPPAPAQERVRKSN
ncbi:MAG TPA: glutathione-regulated potassium-efflux system protein KefB, partial [Hyphomicrobiales bacterium]|nr:glutathione-regulated potassium-efflux system protein KefB [Hyphomicrobiales bacterium]